MLLCNVVCICMYWPPICTYACKSSKIQTSNYRKRGAALKKAQEEVGRYLVGFDVQLSVGHIKQKLVKLFRSSQTAYEYLA